MADTYHAPKHKGPIETQQRSKNTTLPVQRLDLTVGGEQRELCGHRQDRGGTLGATAVIAAILFQRSSFIELDKLLKELLSDCCWRAAREQPSVSVSESITRLSCTRGRRGTEGRGSEQQSAAAAEAAVDGSLDFPHVRGGASKAFATSRGRSDTSPVLGNLLVILLEEFS